MTESGANIPEHGPNGTTTTAPASLIGLGGQAGMTMAGGVSLTNGVTECAGCQQEIDSTQGGTVVAFGQSLWHVDCFRCAKCENRVSADTNLLLLSDGSPVCGNCSYQCFVCKQAITEEAIMTGDESYHAHCFTCRTCKRRIEELVFAKTSQGIYCMACHNERVARSRRHAEAKRQRAARKEKEQRERELMGSHSRQTTAQSEASISTQMSSITLLNNPYGAGGSPPPLSPTATPTNPSQEFPMSVTSPGPSEIPTPLDSGRSREPSADTRPIPPPLERNRSRELSVDGRPARSVSPGPRHGAETLPVPSSPSEPAFNRRPSVDSNASSPRSKSGPGASTMVSASQSMGTAPLQVNKHQNQNAGLGVGPVGLAVPSTKADRRRSINPAMTFNMDAANGTFAAEPRLSPLPPSPLRASFTDLQAGQGVRTPTSPTPGHGSAAFPFPHPAPAPASVAPSHIRQDSGNAPPRTSSLPEQQLSKSRSQNFPQSQPHPQPQGPPQLAPELKDGAENMPRLTAPDLPPMTFSLSDPDFASILKDMDKSPTDPTAKAAPTSTSQGSFISKSPQMDSLASAAGDEEKLEASEAGAGATPTGEPRPTFSQQSTTAKLAAPQMLQTRQASTESINSHGSRFQQDSALHALAGQIASAKQFSDDKVHVDTLLLSNILAESEDLRDQVAGLKSKYSGAKRTSQQYSEGLTVAGEEYDKEVAMRRELEAEVTRLKAQVHTQTARLSVISGDERRQETLKRRSQDLASSLSGLERDISRLRAQRDMSVAEVEELQARRISTEDPAAVVDTPDAVGQALTSRLDTIKEQYREELEPLTAQREALQREIAELRETREQILEESTALTAKNEELAELNTQLTRQNELLQDSLARGRGPTIFSKRTHPSGSPSMSSLATAGTLHEVPEETARVVKVTRPEPSESAPKRTGFKWMKSSKGPDMSGSSASISKPLMLAPGSNRNLQRPATEMGLREHAFQQYSTMRLTRCELCQEKMWGLQEVRCSSCGTICHSKCAEKLPRSCTGTKTGTPIIEEPAGPSMFGRELSEQVVTDNAAVPVIITKCIYAVEAVGMEYEGIYRKTGGSSQSKLITQLFEKGDYDAFDLSDTEVYNDISSVTSVLKNYFRQLPNPLTTHALHESFVTAACITSPPNKNAAMRFAIDKLPKDYYNTLRTLMLHLHRVTQHAGVNLMTSQNIGVVFGPTLMRSADPGREFGDMAGKALSVQWMVDNAPTVFAEARS